MVLHFRVSTPADVDNLFVIWQRSVAATHDFVSRTDRAGLAELVREKYLSHALCTLACAKDGRVLAFMGMRGPEIESLFVDADARGRGVGRALIERARDLSPGGLKLEANEQNAQALGFYARLGFRVIGRTPLDHQGKPYPLLQLAWFPSGATANGEDDD